MTTIRTTCGAYRTLKAAKRDVKRGHARWVGDRLEIIKSNNLMPVAMAGRPAVSVVPFLAPVNVGDSGQSLFPHIGYNMASKGAGKASSRAA